MRLAYVVLAHRLPEQVARLAGRLIAPGNLVLLHVDARVSPAPFTAALSRAGLREDVGLLPRTACRWGGFGLVRASLTGLEKAVEASPAPDYVCLLSGQDYPIRPHAVLEARLRRAEGRAFLSYRPLPASDFVDGGGMDRLERYYLRPSRRWSLPNRYTPFLPRRRLPAGLSPYGGKQFWCLPLDMARYVITFVRDNPDVVRFFSHTFVPDESFFQTVLMSGPATDRVLDDDPHHVERRPGDKHPRVLTSADFAALRSSPAYFARKFDIGVDARILDRVDAELLGSQHTVGTPSAASDSPSAPSG